MDEIISFGREFHSEALSSLKFAGRDDFDWPLLDKQYSNWKTQTLNGAPFRELNLNSQLIAAEFEKRGLSVIWATQDLILVKIANKWIGYSITNSSNTSVVVRRILRNKVLTKDILKDANIVVPPGQFFYLNQKDEASRYVAALKKPLVIKPVDSNKGRGVSVGIRSRADFERAWDAARIFSKKGILIEVQFTKGKEARFLVVGGKCVAVYEKLPPAVTGNGTDDIEALIEMKNNERLKSPHLCNKLISLDAHRVKVLNKQGFKVSSIPARGQKVLIDYKSSISTGGDTADITGTVHSSFKKIAERAVRAFAGLDIVGLDFLAYEYAQKAEADNYVVIEANDRAGIGGHHYPVYGKQINVARKIVDHMLKTMHYRRRFL